MPHAPMPRRIVLVAFPGVQSLDLTGPAEVFSLADRFRPGSYAQELVARGGAELRTSSGLSLRPDGDALGCGGSIDTLVVAGGQGTPEALQDRELIDWIRGAAGRSRRVASVCTGAFLLARAGLLDDRRATTHWDSCDQLRRHFPQIEVETDPIFVKDGNVYTSAGVTAGIDLALALVEEDLGRALALEVARQLVLFVKRSGGQAQFSTQLAAQIAEREPLRELQTWMPDHLAEDLSVPALAERAFMSPRNFARAFSREVGMTPAAYVEALRVERARLALEDAGTALESVAQACGFGTVETMRRAFHRRVGVGPAAYRSRFGAVAGDPGGAPAPTDPEGELVGHRDPAV
jgi:transcriptional regulator GlxA family with amidase domain